MCAKASKPLTSFQHASLLLVWDPIFGFKCMMYYFPYLFLLRMARDLRYVLGALVFVFICVHGVWILTFVVHLSLVTDLLCSAWLGTIGTHPLFLLVECLC